MDWRPPGSYICWPPPKTLCLWISWFAPPCPKNFLPRPSLMKRHIPVKATRPPSLSQWESILGQTPPTIPLSHALKSCQQCHPLPHPYQPPHPYLLHLHPCPDLNLISTKSWIDSSWTFGDLTGQLDLNWAQSVQARSPSGNIRKRMEKDTTGDSLFFFYDTTYIFTLLSQIRWCKFWGRYILQEKKRMLTGVGVIIVMVWEALSHV